MDFRPVKDGALPTGMRRRRHDSCSGIFGNIDSAIYELAQEQPKSPGSLGTPERVPVSSNSILLQGGKSVSPSEVVGLKRSTMARLRSRKYNILVELARDNIAEHVEWQLVDELEAIGDQEKVIRTLKFD